METLVWAKQTLFVPFLTFVGTIVLYHQRREWFYKATQWAIAKGWYAGLEIQDFDLHLNGGTRGHNILVVGTLLVRNKLDCQIAILDPYLEVEGSKHKIKFVPNTLGANAAQGFSIPLTTIQWPATIPVQVRINIKDNSGGSYCAIKTLTPT